MERIRAHRAGGVSKFVAIPIARGDADFTEQVGRLIDEIVPDTHAMV